MVTAPGYQCVNCGHNEPPDPENLMKAFPFKCKNCGKNYRVYVGDSQSQSSPNVDAAHAFKVFDLFASESSKHKLASKIIGLVCFLITFAYTTSGDGVILSYNFASHINDFVPTSLPWGYAILLAFIVGLMGWLLLVGIIKSILYLSIIMIVLSWAWYAVDYFGGWG